MSLAGPGKITWFVGFALGLSAFAADAVPGLTGEILNPIISSMLPWGLAAMLLGYRAQSTRLAAVRAAACLAIAVCSYYLLILVVSRRWSVGSTEDGGSASLIGLVSMVKAVCFWMVAALIGGAIIGLIGYTVARGTIHRRSLAYGVAVGVLGAESWYQSLVILPHWGAAWYHLASWPLVAVLATVAVILIGVRSRVSSSLAVPAAVASLGLAVVAWSQIALVRSAL